MKINWVKIDRLAAWTLLVLMLIFVVSGYGLTKGIISYQVAAGLHLGWLSFILMLAFIIHTSYAIRLALMRHRLWNRYSRAGLAAAYLLLFAGFAYVAVFYQSPLPTTAAAPASSAATASEKSSDKIFTAEELAKYDGLNGQPAYAAVDGIVYDFSSVFRNGDHHGYKAGQDLSAAFHSKHNASILSKYQIVGQLK